MIVRKGVITFENEIFNCGLSAEAIGLLYITCFSDQEDVSENHVCNYFKIGKHKLKRILNELKMKGYLE